MEFDPASGLVTGYAGGSADVSIPATIGGVAVQGIADKAFFTNPTLRRLTLAEGIATIGEQAFFATRLSEVVLPKTLVSIGAKAFAGCNLLQLNLPAGLQTMGEGAFANGKFKGLSLPESLADIPKNAFERNWALEDVVFPAGLKSIAENAFPDCDNMSYLVFGSAQAPQITPGAFAECDKIADIDIAWNANKQQAAAMKDALVASGVPEAQITVWRANPPDGPPHPSTNPFTFDDVTGLVTAYSGDLEALTMYWNFWKSDGSGLQDLKGLGPDVFANSNIKRFDVPHSDQFEIIGDRAFKDSQLEYIHLFDSVREIGQEAFSGCVNLKFIKLPDSIATIGQNAFLGCDSLTTLVLPAGVTILGDLGIAPEAVRIAANASEEQVQALAAALNLPWYMDLVREGEAAAFVAMPNSYQPNPENEFEFDPQSGSITKYIGSASTVVVPHSIGGVAVTGIAYPGFSSPSSQTVTEIILPETVRTISDSAFLNCASLKNVQVYGPIDSLGIRAFENCTSLEEITFHNGIKEMGVYAFNLCENLKKADLGDKLAALPEGAFFGCGFEGELVIATPQVGLMAYKNNAKVTSVRVLNSVQDLEGGVFHGMSALDSVWFENADASFLGEARFQFDEGAKNVKVYIPGNATDEQMALYVNKMNQNLLPGDNMVQRMNTPGEDKQAEIPAAAPDGPETGIVYVCVEAKSGGIAFDTASLGRYAVVFSDDGTAVLTVAGTDLPALSYAVEGGVVTLDYYGMPLLMAPVESGYELDFMGQMVLTMKPE